VSFPVPKRTAARWSLDCHLDRDRGRTVAECERNDVWSAADNSRSVKNSGHRISVPSFTRARSWAFNFSKSIEVNPGECRYQFFLTRVVTLIRQPPPHRHARFDTDGAEVALANVLRKARFWEAYAGASFNDHDLVHRGILAKDAAGGRSKSYSLRNRSTRLRQIHDRFPDFRRQGMPFGDDR
jgi:hypothetical protein